MARSRLRTVLVLLAMALGAVMALQAWRDALPGAGRETGARTETGGAP